MAKCNDSSTLSTEAVSACMRRCEQPLHEVNQVVQQEVGGLQVGAGTEGDSHILLYSRV